MHQQPILPLLLALACRAAAASSDGECLCTRLCEPWAGILQQQQGGTATWPHGGSIVPPAGILEVATSANQPPVAWIFSNMKLVAVIGGAIAAAAITALSGLAILDCCFDRSARKKVAAG